MQADCISLNISYSSSHICFIVARVGPRGAEGVKGEKGMIGMAGLPGPSAYIIARHSQSDRTPACPSGSVKLWDGYSLLHTEDDGRAITQDLG